MNNEKIPGKHGDVKYIIIALVIAASLVFGYKAITGIGKSNCVSHLKDSVKAKAS